MSHHVADKLVDCHESIDMQMRVQSFGWNPDVAKWKWDGDDDDDDEDDWDWIVDW